ncbi:MAG TPA: ATP-binding protein [Actinomycetota bacterium]|nr:ATP-binding protein [Actinomycetota bacterium]
MRPLDRLPTIRAKLGSVIVFAVAVTVLMMYVAIGFAFRTSERDREFRELVAEARGVAALAFTPDGRPSRALQRAIDQVPSPVVVVDAVGRPLAGDLATPPTVGRALRGEVDTGTAGTLEYVGVPVVREGAVVGAVYLAHQLESGGPVGAVAATARFLRGLWWQLLVAGAISAFIALVLARFLARGMTQPLRDMAQAARRMARGDYRQRVSVRSRDEVGQLAEAFNRMAGEMEGLERLRRDLVANVSHELKTPISALRARLENLLDGVERPDPALLGTMLQQSERLSRLVDQLLDLSRLESGDVPLSIEPVPLSPLVDEVVAEVRMARPDRPLEVRNEVPPDLPPLLADRERVHQVLFNLLDNAFRFTLPGGRVTVRAHREDGCCEVAVEDTGPGIPPEHLPLVFERFYRADPARSGEDGGTGIGLAIARSVVEAHGGRIWAESEEGRGSTFRFVLPLALEAYDRAGDATDGQSS